MEYFAEFWNGKYWHIGSKRYAEACSRKDSPVVQVEIKEDENGEYYGWVFTGCEKYEMVWPHKGLFDMQFAYGPEAEVKHGRGRVVRLDIRQKEAQE